MAQTTTCMELNDALAGLLGKYAVKPSLPWQIAGGGQLVAPSSSGRNLLHPERRTPSADADSWTLAPGEQLTGPDATGPIVPLLSWRHERRFVELKRLVDEKTVAPLLMCRFACMTDGRRMPLRAILYREFDLVEWLSGMPIVAVSASMAGDRAANVIVRLAGGVIGSVEAGTSLPPGTAMQDRHELIARRGVASDRAVDTQVGESSVYAWTAAGIQRHTDVDAELFGLDAYHVALVRSAYDVLRRPEQIPGLHQTHRRLRWLVETACESDRRRQRLAVEGGPT